MLKFRQHYKLDFKLIEHQTKLNRTYGIATHAWDEDHRVYWEEASVITVELSKSMGSAEDTECVGSTSNLDCGLWTNAVWLQFLVRVWIQAS